MALAFFCFLLLAASGRAQTFEINSQPPAKTTKKTAQPKKKAGGQQKSAAPASQGLGWGSSIEVGRNSRAAEQALKKGNYAAAMNFAQRVVQSAPNDARNWFLLGYTSRLAGKYSVSLDAYDRGLAKEPSSVEGLSGKAQTYIRMGKADEAKKLLLQVIAANPRRATDLAIAGELFMQSGDLPRATGLLERSEAVQPSSHAELLLAIAYMKQKQTDKAKALLDRAMKRSPRNVDVFRAVAQYYREAHDYKSAIATLQRAPRKTADVMSELGYTYSLAGMKKEAAGSYEKAAAMSPKSANVQLAAAQAELRVGNFDKTRTYLARAEQIDPKYYRLHAIRGDLAVVEHRDQDAVSEYQLTLTS
ncbi:MAG TPA: tetratricopeptide repeat protein, partial [Candidatus Limnocylindrales bacterium]|nr:tetratricopeptide repeat protein [Candidatus Limnocylindrales bacterium]